MYTHPHTCSYVCVHFVGLAAAGGFAHGCAYWAAGAGESSADDVLT